jgi:hypothetical protein
MKVQTKVNNLRKLLRKISVAQYELQFSSLVFSCAKLGHMKIHISYTAYFFLIFFNNRLKVAVELNTVKLFYNFILHSQKI